MCFDCRLRFTRLGNDTPLAFRYADPGSLASIDQRVAKNLYFENR